MKKTRNKKYVPKKINATAHLRVIQGVQPITEDDKLKLFKEATSAINAMQFKLDLTTNDFTTLCDMLNVSLLFGEMGIGREYLPELNEAKEAMQDSKQRYLKTQKLGFTKTELDLVKLILQIHQYQINNCNYAQFEKAFEEQEKRIAKGDFYQREGDLRIAA